MTELAKSTIGDYISGRTLISHTNLQKISDAFGVSKTDINSSYMEQKTIRTEAVFDKESFSNLLHLAQGGRSLNKFAKRMWH